VSARDGLQADPSFIATNTKLALLASLAHVGLSSLEATSFVSPKAVPQFVDAGELIHKANAYLVPSAAPSQPPFANPRRRLKRHASQLDRALHIVMPDDPFDSFEATNDAVIYCTQNKKPLFLGTPRTPAPLRFSALVPNERGLRSALGVGVRQVAVFASASDAFSLRNINCDVDSALRRYIDVARLAHANNVEVRGYISCAFRCPYSGQVAREAVLRVLRALLDDAHCYEVAIADTLGSAQPEEVEALVAFLVEEGGVPVDKIALHLHDTRGRALANARAAYMRGVRVFDGSIGGLGGCPFAPGAPGNVATEDLAWMFSELGVEIEGDVSWRELARIGAQFCEYTGRKNTARVFAAMRAEAGMDALRSTFVQECKRLSL